MMVVWALRSILERLALRRDEIRRQGVGNFVFVGVMFILDCFLCHT